MDILKERKSVDNFAKLVSKDEIRSNKYNLNIPRYIDSSAGEEPWDVHSIMFGGIPKSEVKLLQRYWDTFPGLYDALFREISDKYVSVAVDDIEGKVTGHLSVADYISNYNNSFDGFDENLKDILIEDILDVNAQSIKEAVCKDIFERISKTKLADQYKAFQILSENWEVITADLEMIQGEGFEAIFQVEPNMVIKKKKEDEEEVTEVQEGWKGHVIPFRLVQEEFHSDKLDEIESAETRLIEINNTYAEVLESLEEDELEQPFINEDKNAFVVKELKAFVAEALADVEGPEINALKDYLGLSTKKEKLAFIDENLFVEWDAMSANKDGTYGKPAVNARIIKLQMNFEFPAESLEAKMKVVMLLMEEESELKKTLKTKKADLESTTIETIKNLEEDEALHLLELKWIKPITTGLETIPGDIVSSLISNIKRLKLKYETTYKDIENAKKITSKSIIEMIGELSGNTEDLEGLAEFKKYMEV